MFGRKKKRREDEDGQETPVVEAEEQSAPAERPARPLDRSEVDELGDLLDLGGLWLPIVGGMELRLEVDPSRDEISAAQVMVADSTVQLQAFAAPRSGGLWDEIRPEIADSVTSGGGSAEVVDGPFGRELTVRIAQPGPDGRPAMVPAIFVGVDGPRWFLRAVYSGLAVVDQDARARVDEFISEVVVVRGDSPMAPRELLALQVPPEASTEAQPEDADDEPGRDDLNPFERGPEITEVR